MEKPQLVNFIANILEDSGFKVYKNFKTTQQIVDIYAILPTSMGDFALVVGCKNYDKAWAVGIDVLKEMEIAGKNLKASKVCVITSSKFSEQALIYGEERHMKLVDRKGLIRLAKKYNDKKKEEDLEYYEEDVQIAQPTEPQIHNEQQHIEQKKKFNFPLVKDEETFTKLPKEEDTETSYSDNL